MSPKGKRILRTSLKIAACLALDSILPSIGTWAGLFLGGQGETAGASGAGEGDFVLASLFGNVLATAVTDTWKEHRESEAIASNYHLARAIVGGLAAGLKQAELPHELLLQKMKDPDLVRGFVQGIWSADPLDAVEGSRTADAIVLGINEPEVAFDTLWVQIRAQLRRNPNGPSEAELDKAKELVLGNLRQHVADYLLRDANARAKFAFYADQIQLALQQQTLESLSDHREEILGEIRGLKDEMRGLKKENLEVLLQAHASFAADLRADLTLDLRATLETSLDPILAALARADRAQGLLDEAQFWAVSQDVRKRREGLLLCVGRQEQRNEVFELLETGPRIVLVKGEGGTGKSSFLNSLLEDPRTTKYRVAHHFFRATDKRLRGTRSALLHLFGTLSLACDVELPTSLPYSAEDVASILEQLVHQSATDGGKPVLLVLDALDEAETDYVDVFRPLLAMDGVRVVASVRSAHDERPTPLPFEQDRYSALPLRQELSEAEIREWMERMRDGELAVLAQSDLPGRLRRVTGGLALFVSLLLKDLAHDPSRDLSGLDGLKGLEDYIVKEWESLSGYENSAPWLPLLILMAAAEGKFRRADVRKVLPDLPAPAPPWFVMRWIRAEGVGDGEAWRFDHPRFQGGFRLVPAVRDHLPSIHRKIAEAGKARQLDADYRLAYGVHHALQAQDRDLEAWALDRLADYEYVLAKVEAEQVSALLRECGEMERCVRNREEEDRLAI